MFIFNNPNPKGLLVGDCVPRAISIATARDWHSVMFDLNDLTHKLCDMASSNYLWGTYLNEYGGFVKRFIRNPHYTVREFTRDHRYGVYILATGTHVVTVIDGNHIDTWDSGDELVLYFWEKEY